jgi:hypothetical protein
VSENTTSPADIIRVSAYNTGKKTGTIAIEDGVRLAQGTYKMLTAASWAVLLPAPYLEGSKPRQVKQFVASVQIDQVKEAQFTLQLVSPLTELDELVFERQATLGAANALQALSQAITGGRNIKEEEIPVLVEKLVTANLCDAVVQMIGKPKKKSSKRISLLPEGGVIIGFSWAEKLSAPAGTPESITFEMDQVPQIKDLAELLRATEPKKDFTYRGLVTDLKRSDSTGLGKVVISSAAQQPDKITIELEAEQYEVAIEAHRTTAPITCTGTLIKNRGFELIDAVLTAGVAEPER